MSSKPAGLPMVSMRDAEALEAEKRYLAELARQPLGKRLLGYTALSGPGWLQSAFTLGGGTMGSSMVVGTLLGYSILWVQPLAMICGVIMLSALAYQTLSTNMRPLEAVRVHVHPAMAYGWALTSLLASMIWCMPQYSLSISVIDDMTGVKWSGARSLVPSLIIFAVTLTVTWNYGGSRGVRMYETVIKLMVAGILLCFGLVVVRTGVDWAQLAKGLFGFHVPYPGHFYPQWAETARAASEAAAALGKEDPQFMLRVGREGFDSMIAAFATAVGINMTFLFPYSLRARGWSREHRGLARFDLWTGMLIPFVVVTALILIAAGNRLHGDANTIIPAGASPEEIYKITTVDIFKPTATKLAKALEPVAGNFFAHYIFGLGVLGMAMSTITLLMLVSGFIVMELSGAAPGSAAYRIGTLLPAVGILGPLVWSNYGFYMAVPTSVICFLFLPIAYVSFFVLHNRRAYLGDALPTGGARIAWNTAMAVVIAIVAFGSLRAVYLKFPDLLKLLGLGG